MGALLGIDVGGTKVALCVAGADGALLARRRHPTRLSGDATRDVADLAEDARALLAEAGLAGSDLARVGVSLPGPLDPDGQRVLDPPNLPGWHDVPVGALLAEALGGVPVHLENDANAAALAEWRFGAGRGFQDLVFLTMSTGIGGGIIVGGQLVRGHTWSAGEIGHANLVWDGEPCFCGLRGCVEAYVGGRAWSRRLQQEAPPDSAVARLAAGAAPSPVHVVQAAREGDPFARGEIARFNRYLAQTLVNVAFTLDPQVIVLGTIVASAGDDLVLDPVRELVRPRLWPRLAEGLEIRAAELGEEGPYYAGIAAALSSSADGSGAG